MSNLKNIFVYCGGKCGSSTLHNTFIQNGYESIHLHNNLYYKFNLKHEDDIFQLINLSVEKFKKIYIIDAYRTPIERKISSFFQNITIYLPNYYNLKLDEIIDFFNNNLIEHIEEYHSINEVLEYYNVPLWNKFDFENNYNTIESNGIIFIKILFKDIKKWDDILSKIFGKQIKIYNDNLTQDKSINNLYKEFKKNYKVPKTYIFNILINDKEFKIYNTEKEQEEYINYWLQKSLLV
jgi:hypothetical protein